MRFITALALAVLFATAQAQSYPTRPITMVVPFPPGGIADITGRPFGAVMSRILGQPVIIENKTGAGGAVGHAYAARAKPDGYTLMMALSSIVIIPVADEVNGRADRTDGAGRCTLEDAERPGRRSEGESGEDQLQLLRPLRHHAHRDRDVRAGRRHPAPPRAVQRRRPGDEGGARQ